MTTLQESTFNAWGILGVFTLSFSVMIVSISSLGLLLPEISDEMSLSPSQQGWLGSSVLFANVLFSIPINLWLSRYRPRITATITYLAGTLIIAFTGWAPTFAVLLVGRIGLGLVQQASQAPRTLLIIQLMSRKRFAAANGFSISIVDILMGVGFITIPFVMELVGGWRNTLYTWAGVSLFTTTLWIVFGRYRVTAEYREQAQAQTGTPLTSLFKYREAWYIGLGIFGVLMAKMAFSNFWPTYLQDEYSMKVTTAGFLLGATSLAMAPAELGMSLIPFATRHKPLVLALCGVAGSLSYVGLLVTSSIPLLLLLSIANGASFGFFPIILTMLYELPGIKPREVAVASSLVFTLLWAGGAVGPLTVGFLQESTDSLKVGLLVISFAPMTLVAASLLFAEQGRRVPSLVTDLSEGGLGRLSTLLKIDETALLSRLQEGEGLTEIARGQGVGRRRMKATLTGYFSEAAIAKLLAKGTRGSESFQLLTTPSQATDETRSPTELKGQPRRV